MAQQLRVPTAFAENLSKSQHPMEQLTAACNSDSEGYNALFWIP